MNGDRLYRFLCKELKLEYDSVQLNTIYKKLNNINIETPTQLKDKIKSFSGHNTDISLFDVKNYIRRMTGVNMYGLSPTSETDYDPYGYKNPYDPYKNSYGYGTTHTESANKPYHAYSQYQRPSSRIHMPTTTPTVKKSLWDQSSSSDICRTNDVNSGEKNLVDKDIKEQTSANDKFDDDLKAEIKPDVDEIEYYQESDYDYVNRPYSKLGTGSKSSLYGKQHDYWSDRHYDLL